MRTYFSIKNYFIKKKAGMMWLYTLGFLCLAVVFSFIVRADFLFSSKDRPGEVHTKQGLKILFMRDESLPFIQYRMFFPNAGADYDPQGKSGLAAFTAYLSEQGAGNLSAEAFQESLNQLGTAMEIAVHRQTADIVLSGLSSHAGQLWELFKKLLTEPHFDSEEMEILRKQLLKNRLSTMDRAARLASMVWRESLFKGTVGLSEGGNLISLSGISLEDIRGFYQSHYFEGGGIFMLSGQYDERLKKEIVSFFEDWTSGSEEKTEKNFMFEENSLEPEFLLLSSEKLLQSEIRMGYVLEAFPVKDPEKFIGLQLLNSILGSGSGMKNRLFQVLREESGLSYNPHSYLSFGRFYGLFLALSGAAKTESTAEFLTKGMATLLELREEGVSVSELNRAKQTLKSSYLKKMETPESRLNQFVYYRHYMGLPEAFLDNYLNILQSFSVEEINRLSKEYILSRPLKILVYGHPSLRPSLEGLAEAGSGKESETENQTGDQTENQTGDQTEKFPSLQSISFEDYFKEELAFKEQNSL